LSQVFSPHYFSRTNGDPPPLRLKASHCSTFRIMCDVPSSAVFCSESIAFFPGTASTFFFQPFVTMPVAPIITLYYYYYYYYYYYPCYHLSAGYLQLYAMFLGYVVLQLCDTCNVISPVEYVMYIYISTSRNVCVQCPMWLLLVVP